MRSAVKFLLGFFLVSLACSAFAEETLFTFLYTTDLLPQGRKEVQQWTTWRHEKIAGTFDLIDERTGFQYGLSDDIQVSVYAIYDWTQAYLNGPNGATTTPEPFSYDVPPADAHYHRMRYIGTAVEAIGRVLSPYTDWMGLALYEQPTVGQAFYQFDTRVILQKDFMEDRLVLALNFAYTPEFRHYAAGADTDGDGNGDYYTWDEETDVNAYFGASYRFIENWSAGFEFLNEREYSNSYNFKKLSNCGYYLGPSVHYGGKNFFFTFAPFEQMPWATSHTTTVSGALVGGRIYDNDFEKYRVRVKAGYYF